MRWPAWFPWGHRPPADGEAARRAQTEARRKLEASRRDEPAVRHQIDSFTRAVDRAMRGHQ